MTELQKYELSLAKIVEHDEKTKKLQSKMLLQYDDDVCGVKGLDRLLAMSRHAIVFGRLWQMMTRQAAMMKENVLQSGIEIVVNEDVPIERVSELMAVPLSPKRDPNVEARTMPNHGFDEPTQLPGTVV